MGCFGLLAFLVVVTMCSSNSGPSSSDAPPPAEAPAQSWNSGGTLHKSTDREWLAGSAADRLATAADWAAVSKDKFGFTDEAGMRDAAVQIMACVDESAKADANQNASELAALCVILLTKN